MHQQNDVQCIHNLLDVNMIGVSGQHKVITHLFKKDIVLSVEIQSIEILQDM